LKKVEVFIRPEKLEGLKELLTKHGSHGMSVFSVMGCGKQKGYTTEISLSEFTVNLLPKLCVISVVEDEELDLLLTDISEILGTATIGDGKVFVYNVADAMRIRTGERGRDAL
jgi:nitrogen regulatory protein P-II 1